VSELDRDTLRTLAAWDPEVPVTSLYLTVDGRLYPRRSDYQVRLDELVRDVRTQMNGMAAASARSVERDLERIGAFVGDLERGDTRGLALFSASEAGLWEEIRLPRPVRDRAVIAPRAEVRMLEAMLETYGTTCVALVDFEKARLFLTQLGRIEELADVWDEVPGRHEQGGRAQMRMQRHVDDHRQRHLKHVAEALFGLWKARGFDRLILAGPGEAHQELERVIHGYLRRLVTDRIALPMSVGVQEVRARTLEIEEALERQQERDAVERLAAAAAVGSGVTGLDGTLAALADRRVADLVVRLDARAPGGRCGRCGRLAPGVGTCPGCGAEMDGVADVVEVAVANAYGQGCRVETVVEDAQLVALGGIGALLRY